MTAGADTNNSYRYSFINSLRGLASILVLYLHSAELLLQAGQVTNRFEIVLMTAMTKVVDVGKVGVIVFFAISGFVIPSALLKMRYSVAEFAINRFAQLYPAYWLSIALALYVLYYLERPTYISSRNRDGISRCFSRSLVSRISWICTGRSR